jgi:hypothetical protein
MFSSAVVQIFQQTRCSFKGDLLFGGIDTRLRLQAAQVWSHPSNSSSSGPIFNPIALGANA